MPTAIIREIACWRIVFSISRVTFPVCRAAMTMAEAVADVNGDNCSSARFGEHDVARLQVAVDHTILVGFFQSLADLDPIFQYLFRR